MSGSKRGLDFQTLCVKDLDGLKKTQLLPPGASGARDQVTLSDAMPLHFHPGIPRLLLILVQAFVDAEAYKEVGIFRIAADADEKKRIRNELGVVGVNVWMHCRATIGVWRAVRRFCSQML